MNRSKLLYFFFILIIGFVCDSCSKSDLIDCHIVTRNSYGCKDAHILHSITCSECEKKVQEHKNSGEVVVDWWCK